MIRKLVSKLALSNGALNSAVCAALLVGSTTGCNLCCPPYMDDYATIGGKWPRVNPSEGTVGSAFSDPGVVLAGGENFVDAGSMPYQANTVIDGEYLPAENLSQPSLTQPHVEDGVIAEGDPEAIMFLDE